MLIPFSAVAMLAAAEVAPPAPCPVVLPLATASAEAQNEMQAAMVDLLLGWEESARIRLERATEADDLCSLAWCGLLLTEPEPAERAKNLQALNERIDKLPTTPVEAFYLATFLKLAANDQLGAAEDFLQRAAQYRADTLSACWGILLLHCVDWGYDLQGNPLPHQARALQLARELYAAHPQNPLVCFVRAYVEENAPLHPGEEALEAARKAAELLPQHPIPAHLLGHLLYRSGKAEEAIPHLMQAATLATRKDIPEWESSVLMGTRLYVSTAMWSAGQKAKALATRRAMNSMPLDREHLHAPAVILQRWEAATLPLRVLVAAPKAPTRKQIIAASKAAEVSPALPGNDPVLLVRDCLNSTLYARLRAAQGDSDYALKSLALAEQALHDFERTKEATLTHGVHYITPWLRAHEACLVAIHTARADVYTRTADMWRESAKQSVRPVTLMLPPVIPTPFAEEETDRKSAKESAKVSPNEGGQIASAEPKKEETNAQPRRKKRATKMKKKPAPAPAAPQPEEKKSWFGRLFD